MAFKSLVSAGMLSSVIDAYLISRQVEDDRKRGVAIYSPSTISKGCELFMHLDKLAPILGLEVDSFSTFTDPQRQRIFMNGDDMHERLQNMLLDTGFMKYAEVALNHPTNGVFGTCDGFCLTGDGEIVIAEFKTINENNFNQLKYPSQSYINQATIYVGLAEIRRQELHKHYKNVADYIRRLPERIKHFVNVYFSHIRSGRKYSRKQKLQMLVEKAVNVDMLLLTVQKPIERFSILYENKNTQKFKEFTMTANKQEFDALMLSVERTEKTVNHVMNKSLIKQKNIMDYLPRRDASKTPTCDACKWCNYKEFCYSNVAESESVDDGAEVKTKTKRSRALRGR